MKTLIACTFCHRISEDNINWLDLDPDQKIENTDFRYGICMECSVRRFEKFYNKPQTPAKHERL